MVYSKSGPNLLVDVRPPVPKPFGPQGFETWTTEQDVADLMQWEQVFGEGYKALITFIYWIDPPLTPAAGHVELSGPLVPAMGVALSEYRNHMRRRSAKWETVALPAEDFRSLAKPIESWL